MYYGHMPMMYGYGYAGGWSVLGFLGMLFWWALIIIAIISLIRWSRREGSCGTHGHERSALEILKIRYAKGEIDKKEFEEKKKELGS